MDFTKFTAISVDFEDLERAIFAEHVAMATSNLYRS